MAIIRFHLCANGIPVAPDYKSDGVSKVERTVEGVWNR
jgi:hypothetical protein